MSNFPTYHKIQSIWKRTERGVFIPWEWARPELEYLSTLEWEWTEKVDGTNIRIRFDVEDGMRIGGRTDRAQIPTTLRDAIAALDLLPKLSDMHTDAPITLYGEGYGAKIQKGGGNYRPDQGFVLFDVQVGRWWLERVDVEDVANKLGIDVVPVVAHGTIGAAIDHVCDGMRSSWGDFDAEGVVCRPVVPLFARGGSRVICKVKTKDFQRLRREGIRW
jgi:hypothetical protein